MRLIAFLNECASIGAILVHRVEPTVPQLLARGGTLDRQLVRLKRTPHATLPAFAWLRRRGLPQLDQSSGSLQHALAHLPRPDLAATTGIG